MLGSSPFTRCLPAVLLCGVACCATVRRVLAVHPAGTRTFGMGSMTHHAQMWVAENFPYYNRSGGRDHIWVWAHDEGACYAHKNVWPGARKVIWR